MVDEYVKDTQNRNKLYHLRSPSSPLIVNCATEFVFVPSDGSRDFCSTLKIGPDVFIKTKPLHFPLPAVPEQDANEEVGET